MVRNAVLAMGYLPPNAVKKQVKLFCADSAPLVQLSAALAIHRLKSAECNNTFVELMGHKDFAVRASTARVLGKVDIPDRTRLLAQALGDSKVRVRTAAVRAAAVRPTLAGPAATATPATAAPAPAATATVVALASGAAATATPASVGWRRRRCRIDAIADIVVVGLAHLVAGGLEPGERVVLAPAIDLVPVFLTLCHLRSPHRLIGAGVPGSVAGARSRFLHGQSDSARA